MMLSPQPVNELQHLAKLTRESVYPTKTSTILPAKYNPIIVWMRELKDIPVNIETTMQSITDLKSVLPEQIRPQRHETGVIDSLYDELQSIQNDIESVYKPTWTKSLRLNNMLQNQIDDYFSQRMSRYVQRIYQHFQALVTLDDWDKALFGDYESIIKAFEFADTDSEKQRHLDELILIGLSIIPSHIKTQTTRNIESSLTSTVRTT